MYQLYCQFVPHRTPKNQFYLFLQEEPIEPAKHSKREKWYPIKIIILLKFQIKLISKNKCFFTSPNPSKARRAIRAGAPPLVTTIGVNNVKTAVDKIPSPKEYFPPNFSAIIPPGMWVITYP